MWLPDVLLLPGGVRVAGGGTATVGPFGAGSAFNGTNQSIALGRDALSHGRGARIAWLRVGSASGTRTISGGGNGGTSFRLNGTGVELINAGVQVDLSAASSVSAGEFCALGMSAESFNLRLYKNGALLASRSDRGTGSTVNNLDSLGQSGVSNQYFDGALFMHASFSARLSDEDQASLVQNPWQLFEQRRIWVPVSSSGGAHGASGSLASAGSAISGSASRSRVHAAAGGLAASSAAVAGAASRLVVHAANGVLASAAATVAGLAKRFRTHATTGGLAAGASAVAGAANRDTSGSNHTASGVLAVGSALVTGVARRVGVHSASGALQADAAALSGAATRIAGPEPVTLATPPGTYFFWWRAAAASEGQ